MNRDQDIYLYLLRCAIWGRPIERKLVGVDWRGVMDLSNKQGTSALICDQILKVEEPDGVNSQLRITLKQIGMQNMLSQQQMSQLLRKTWDALTNKGLRPVLLKGFGLSTLYPLPHLRQWGDADVYIGPEHYHEGCAALREAFPKAEHHEEEWDELKHYNFVMPEGVIELHRTAMKFENLKVNRYYQVMETEAMKAEHLQTVDMEGISYTIPEAKYNILYVFAHAWEHFVESGVGMKQLCDVALLVHEAKEKNMEVAEYIEKGLKKLRLLDAWKITGVMLVEAIGLTKEEWPLYDDSLDVKRRGMLLYDRVMREGLRREKKSRWKVREEGRNLPLLKRKIYTYRSRMEVVDMIRPYSPEYARHLWWTVVLKGIRRTLKNERMIEY